MRPVSVSRMRCTSAVIVALSISDVALLVRNFSTLRQRVERTAADEEVVVDLAVLLQIDLLELRRREEAGLQQVAAETAGYRATATALRRRADRAPRHHRHGRRRRHRSCRHRGVPA